MSIFNFFKQKEQPNLFSGGSGDSFETAVIVIVGVKAEYVYVENQCGKPQRDWKIQSQSLQERGGKPYDVLTIVLNSGEIRTFYFNASNWTKLVGPKA